MSATRLVLSRSWVLAAAIVALHGAAAVCVVAVMPNTAGYALAGALLALGGAAAWSRALHGAGRSIRALELSGAQIRLELGNGDGFLAVLAERRHVGRFMVTLPLVRPVRRTVLVTRDMLGREEFRRLCLWALWGRLPKVVHKQLPA